ncbi:MAG: hypothetical protein ACR2QE_11410 [Acidimicrobiales bacterium]
MRAPWLFRLGWLVIPFAAGPTIADALHSTATPGRTIVSIAAWLLWALIMVATVVPRTATLTMVRVVAPATVVAVVWATAEAGFDATAAVGLVVTTVTAALSFDPALGESFANGSAYGDEIRLLLRAPAAVMVGPLPVAWMVTVAGLSAGPLLLAYQQWLPGAVAVAVGVPLAGLAARSLHTLTRRWLIFVPGGLVVHDPLALGEPVLAPGQMIMSVIPAPAEGGERLDLTGGAFGLALQVDLDPPVAFGVTTRPRRTVVTETTSVLVTPTRPNRVLELAQRWRRP